MAATKRQLNWAAVTHNSVAITGITNLRIAQGGQILTSSADNDRYTTFATLVMSKPTVTIETLDVAAAMGIASGTTGAFAATHKDAKGATDGDILWAITNVVIEDVESGGAHMALGSATIKGFAVSSDGQTNPISFTRA